MTARIVLSLLLVAGIQAITATQAIASPAQCVVQPVTQASVLVGKKTFDLDVDAAIKPRANVWAWIETATCVGRVTQGSVTIKLREKEGWREFDLTAPAEFAEGLKDSQPIITLAQILMGMRSVVRGTAPLPGLPYGKVLRPANGLTLAISHSAAQTLTITPPLVPVREPLVLQVGAGETALIPSDYLMPGGTYRYRLERSNQAVEGKFQVLRADEQGDVEQALAKVDSASPDFRELLRASQLNAAGLEFDRDQVIRNAAAKP